MDQYNWTRIGSVYNTGSLFHSEIANYLQNATNCSTNKKVELFIGLRGVKQLYLEAAVSSIRNKETTIIVSMLNAYQISAILHLAEEQNLVFPQYSWIHIEKLQGYFQYFGLIDNSTFGHYFSSCSNNTR